MHIERATLSQGEARRLTDDIKAQAERLCFMLLEAYEGGAHLALGYSSWGAYFEEEFGGGSRAYQLLDSGRVVRAVEGHSTIVERSRPNEAQARELAPLLRRDEKEMLEVWAELRVEYGDTITANRVRNLVGRRLDRIRREEDARLRADTQPPTQRMTVGGADIRHCDFRSLDLPDGSADLIFTDPPYGAAHLDLWRDLGEFAASALKPGGVLVAFSGQRHLPEVLDALRGHLDYLWMAAVGHRRGSRDLWSPRVQNRWKPMVVFARGRPESREPLMDGFWLGDRDGKEHHVWGQAEIEAERIIETFTDPGGLVVDPFLGGGTTALACLRSGRRFLGCDVDGAAIGATLGRLELQKNEAV